MSVTVNVEVDEMIFHKFSVFENFVRRRGAVRLGLFAGLMTAFAVVCYMFEDGAFLGTLLLVVGLGLPAYNLYRFYRILKIQIGMMELRSPKSVYTLHLTDAPDGIEVKEHETEGGSLRFKWEGVHAAYRVGGCSYLYVLPNKAFLIPDGQPDEGDEALWRLLDKMLPEAKVHDKRKGVRSP